MNLEQLSSAISAHFLPIEPQDQHLTTQTAKYGILDEISLVRDRSGWCRFGADYGWPFGRGRLEANAKCCQMLPYFCLWTVFLYLLDVGLNVGLPNKRVVVM